MLKFSKFWKNNGSAKNPVLKKMDMRNLSIPSNSMDFVINMFISFGFFETDEENESVVKEFYKVLKPGGKVLIHLDLNYDNVIRNRFNGMEHIFRECNYNGYIRTLEIDEKYNPITKRLEGAWTLNNGNRSTKHYSLRIYDNENEFIPLFESNGFKDVVVLDPSTGEKANRNSVETILIAEK
jgi:ubiquinone/menaquinone biosynthesis C-methylase UbiE